MIDESTNKRYAFPCDRCLSWGWGWGCSSHCCWCSLACVKRAQCGGVFNLGLVHVCAFMRRDTAALDYPLNCVSQTDHTAHSGVFKIPRSHLSVLRGQLLCVLAHE